MNTLKTNAESLKKLSNCIRILSCDAIEKAKSGHPGLPLGMADVMTTLAFEFMKYKPEDPKWADRDRLVLSAGHGSMLLYAFYYLAGYKDFTIEDLQNFRQMGSKAAGHPEYGMYPAIETTTGPLGQGLANAVGMAIVAKKLGKKHKIYVIVGDGCLMEGISYEAISLAGHLKLDNLIILFDDNKITIDGDTSLAVSENHSEKFHAMGWNTFSADGHNFEDIHHALNIAYFSSKPSMISFRTIIGYGAPTKAGSELVHGSPLGAEEAIGLRNKLGWTLSDPFTVPGDLLNTWRNAWKNNYQDLMSNTEHKEFSYDLECSILYEMHPSNEPEATRVSSGRVVSYLMHISNRLIVGSADLAGSNNLISPTARVINHNDYSGNFMHYGVREHAMGAIMNGLALEGVRAVGGTFLVFSDYMRAPIRLAAMMGLPVIYVFTHDSIGLGEDGPTHQPVEHLASLRAIPNLWVFRPADFVETVEAWQLAWARRTGPSVIALSRQAVHQIRSRDDVNLSTQGAYVIFDMPEPRVTLFATGSEVEIAMSAAKKLYEEHQISVRVVSVVCKDLFATQDEYYRDEILYGSKLNVVIEAGIRMGWEGFLGQNGIFIGVEEFGHSAPYKTLYEHFGITSDNIVQKVLERV